MAFKWRKGRKELLSLYTNDAITVKQRKEKTEKEDEQKQHKGNGQQGKDKSLRQESCINRIT